MPVHLECAGDITDLYAIYAIVRIWVPGTCTGK